MAKNTNVLQDAWAGWLNFVREVTGSTGGRKSAGLKTRPKRPNKAQLKRNLKTHRRPQPKRVKSANNEEAELLEREPAEDEPKLAVDPPKPFMLDKEFLETPPERVSRLEKAQKKSRCARRWRRGCNRLLLPKHGGTSSS